MANYKTIEADVAVLGGGIAGCLAAIKAREQVNEVVLVDKGKVGRSGCSPFAAGIFLVRLPEDDFDVWMEELVKTGDFLSDQRWVKTYLEDIYPLAETIDGWARQQKSYIFERDEAGQFIRRRSRGHRNTAHCVINSLPMMDTLRRKAVRSGVKIIDRVAVTDILVKDGQAVGALGFNYRKSEIIFIKARALVNAGGGCAYGSVFMGIKNLTGDLQAAAYRAGAVLQNMEFGNSNTTARDYDIHGLNLIVSAGGRFLNNRDEEFMWEYHPELGSRAPQAYLTAAFCREVAEGRGPVMLDLSAAKPDERELLRRILPETFKVFDRAGIDIFSQRLPWIPAFQGTIAVGGGLAINSGGETNLPGLYAAGDATPLPVNGAPNVGGLCLSVAALTGYRAGESAAVSAAKLKPPSGRDMDREVAAAITELMTPLGRIEGLSADEVVWAVQDAIIPMERNYIKSKERLEEALAQIETIKAELPKLMAKDLHELVNVVGAKSMVTLAELFLNASIFREESRGLHFREDFPKTNNRDWLKWVKIQKQDGGAKLWAEDIPTPYVRPSEEFSLPPGVKRV